MYTWNTYLLLHTQKLIIYTCIISSLTTHTHTHIHTHLWNVHTHGLLLKAVVLFHVGLLGSPWCCRSPWQERRRCKLVHTSTFSIHFIQKKIKQCPAIDPQRPQAIPFFKVITSADNRFCFLLIAARLWNKTGWLWTKSAFISGSFPASSWLYYICVVDQDWSHFKDISYSWVFLLLTIICIEWYPILCPLNLVLLSLLRVSPANLVAVVSAVPMALRWVFYLNFFVLILETIIWTPQLLS